MADSTKPHDASVALADQFTAVKKRLEEIQQDLARERRRSTRTTVLTVLAGTIALAAMGVYFHYGYREFASVTEPKQLIDFAEVMLDEKVPEARSALEKEIVKSAPAWAEGLSKQAQDNMPLARERITDNLVDQAERMAQEAEILSEQRYRAYLRENKPMLERKMQELSKSPKLAEQSLKELEIPLEAQMAGDLKVDAVGLSRDISAMAANLKRLSVGKDLTPEQKVERRVFMLARRLQTDTAVTLPGGQ